jgi:hypothetical protein
MEVTATELPFIITVDGIISGAGVCIMPIWLTSHSAGFVLVTLYFNE